MSNQVILSPEVRKFLADLPYTFHGVTRKVYSPEEKNRLMAELNRLEAKPLTVWHIEDNHRIATIKEILSK